MLKTNITETLPPKNGSSKRKLRGYRKRAFSATIKAMARDANNPTKVRAQNRAYEIGKTLTQVYKAAGVNLAYLSELPKGGWRHDKLEAIAKALDWSVDDLMKGAAEDRQPPPHNHNGDLLELSIEIAVDVLRSIRTDPTAPKVGRLSRLIFESLQLFLSSGESLPSRRMLYLLGRRLTAAWMDALTAREA